MEKIKKFVENITKSAQKSHKMLVLSEALKNDPEMAYFLNFMYNPYITTGISTKKLNKVFPGYEQLLKDNFHQTKGGFAQLQVLLDYLQEHNTGTDVDIKFVRQFRFLYFSDCVDLFDKIVTKNLQLGIDFKTINDVSPGLIPEFSVMLANKYFDNPSIVGGKRFALTTKIDGARVIAIKEKGNVIFYSRAGQIYEGLSDLQRELENFDLDNIALDGELTICDKGDLASKEQYKKAMKILRKGGEKHGIKMIVFDVMTASQFVNKECPTKYEARRNYLDSLFAAHKFQFFEKLPTLYVGSDASEIDKWLDYNVNHKEEGVMINFLDSPYEFKRSNALLKVKKMKDVDLPVVGFEEGINKNQGKLGALLVEYEGNIVRVGSGFTDKMRKEIWANRDEWFGRTVVVQYFEETTNKLGQKSLRFPVFIDYREDK